MGTITPTPGGRRPLVTAGGMNPAGFLPEWAAEAKPYPSGVDSSRASDEDTAARAERAGFAAGESI